MSRIRKHTKKIAKKTAIKHAPKKKEAKSHKTIEHAKHHESTSKKSQKLHAAHHTPKKVLHKIVHKQYAKKFCPNCGKPIIDDNTLCKDCRTVDFDFKEIKLFVCNNCKSFNHKNKWQEFSDLNEVLKRIVEENVKHKVHYHGISDEKIEELLSYKAGVHRDFTVQIETNKQFFDLPAVIDVTLCTKCSKQGTKYFEGILQVRNQTEEIRNFIKQDLHKQKAKGVHINKEVDLDGTGINMDYFYTDKGYVKIIADKLRKQFGATLKHNAQLFSIDWETSKNLYRLNVLAELPTYHKNDVLKIDEQLYKIISMDERIHVLNLKTKTKTLFPHKNSYDVLKPVEVMLIKKYPEFEILDPNTYYQARLMNPSETLEINQKIQVIIDGGEAWIVKE